MTKIAIAHLSEKYLRKTKENKSYYLLYLTLHKSLTRLYSQLTKTKTCSLKSKPLYLFPEKNKWGAKLKLDQTYLFHYQKQNNYLHLTDWSLLGDPLTIKRTLKLIKNEPTNL